MSPGDSMPYRFTRPGTPWVSGPCTTKSAACSVGPLIFGLAYEFNFAGMANSMAHGFSQLGSWYILLAPVLGWIAVALSGSNTSSNAIFGAFQYTVGKLLHFPL